MTETSHSEAVGDRLLTARQSVTETSHSEAVGDRLLTARQSVTETSQTTHNETVGDYSQRGSL